MKHHGERKTGDCTQEEENKDKLVNEGNITATLITEGFDIEDNGEDDKTKKTKKMSPDVASL